VQVKNDPCPCGSSKKAIDCCLTSAGYWHKAAAIIAPPAPATGYANSNCSAASLQDCASKTCREHFISENVLKQIAQSGVVKIAGLSWQPAEVFAALPTNAIASRVLCTRHGDALSPLDAEFGRFFGTLEEIDDALRDGKEAQAFRLFSGENLERWMLKMLLGAVSSENFTSRLKEDCLELL